jgi:crotonobetainyl-CoA:carnitine CoA-transferase CaiB-like acyl-CoA transferase
MADRTSLQLIGWIFGSLTAAVAVVAAVVVHKTITGQIVLDSQVITTVVAQTPPTLLR